MAFDRNKLGWRSPGQRPVRRPVGMRPLEGGGFNKPRPTQPGAAAPTAPKPPTSSATSGYFFNPWSDTLWSQLGSDGQVQLHAQRPGSGAMMLSDFSNPAVSQYKLEGTGVGNIAAGMDLLDASSFMDATSANVDLLNQLEPHKAALAKLNAGGPGGTLYDTYANRFKEQWDDQHNAALSNLAANGMYSGGALNTTLAKSAEAKADGLLQLSQQYGDLARNDVTNQMEVIRRVFGRDQFANLVNEATRKQQADIQDALENPTLPAARPGARMTMDQARKRFKGARTMNRNGELVRTRAWTDFLRKNGLLGSGA